MLLANERRAWRVITLVQPPGEHACAQLRGSGGARLGGGGARCGAAYLHARLPLKGAAGFRAFSSQSRDCLRCERHRDLNAFAGAQRHYQYVNVFPMNVTIKPYAPSQAAHRRVYSHPRGPACLCTDGQIDRIGISDFQSSRFTVYHTQKSPVIKSKLSITLI